MKQGKEFTLRNYFITCLIVFMLLVNILLSGSSPQGITVKDAFLKTDLLVYPSNGKPVNLTVVNAMQKIIPNAKVMALNKDSKKNGKKVFSVSIIDEGLTKGPTASGHKIPKDKNWMFFRINKNGEGELVTSKPHLLYALFCQIKNNWLDEDITKFEKGRLVISKFRWLTGG
ncbi:MAG: hypothetical protein ACFFCW_25190, partial [Candidatus Hodarchaeota archaeon]